MPKLSRGPSRKKQNLLKRDGISAVDWKDVHLLRKFIFDRGKIRARRVTSSEFTSTTR